MEKEINRYISEFETVFKGEPLYGKSILAVVKEGDPKAAFKKPNAKGHSAYEITHHLYAWRDLLVKRLNGDTSSKISMNSKEDWTPLPEEKSAATWKNLVKKLEQNQQDLIKALSKWKDASLDLPFAGTKYALRIFLDGQLQHDIYHTGQVALAFKNS